MGRIALLSLAVTSLVLAVGPARADCDAQPLAGTTRSVVAERVWVSGVALSIDEYRSLGADDARRRFTDYWSRAGRPVRTQVAHGVEVTSMFRDGCLYALQLPTDGANGLPPRLVTSDLRRGVPSLPHTFEWPPAAEGAVLTDTISEDVHRLGRLLSYRVEQSPELASNKCLLRLTHADWKIGTLAKVLGSNYSFNAHKASTNLDVTVTKDGSGAIVTLNFSEVDG